MIEKYGAEAKKNGALLVSLCGMDSVPADMGTYFLVREMRKRQLLPTSVMAGVSAKGGVSGGTIASGLNLMETSDKSLRKHLTNPFAMIQEAEKRAAVHPNGAAAEGESKESDAAGSSAAGQASARPRSSSRGSGAEDQEPVSREEFGRILKKPTDAAAPGWVPALDSYGAPFIMAPVNCRVVLRSAAIAAGQGPAHRYSPTGTPFEYQERMQTSSLLTAVSIAGGTAAAVIGLAMPCTRCILKRYLPKSGDGPDFETMRTGFLNYTYAAEVGRAADGEATASKDEGEASSTPARVFATLTADGDPGYFLTAQMLAECALSLAQDGDKLPGRAVHGGGYLTPAAAFGDVLLDRLTENVGFRFTYHGEERPKKVRASPADMSRLGLTKDEEERAGGASTSASSDGPASGAGKSD